MIAKELIEARGKVIIAVVLTVAFTLLISFSYDLLRDALGPAIGTLPALLKSQVEAVMGDFSTYVFFQWFGKNGQMLLGGLAAFLGGGLIASEVSKGTIFFLLSKPVSRLQVFLTKYGVAAALQLGICLLSALCLLIAGAVTGHSLDIMGLTASALLIWLGTLWVLGVASLFSILFDDLLKPVGLAMLIAILVGIPGLVAVLLPEWAAWSLPNYWYSLPAFQGTGFPTKELAVCFVAALVPVAIALPLFRKKAY